MGTWGKYCEDKDGNGCNGTEYTVNPFGWYDAANNTPYDGNDNWKKADNPTPYSKAPVDFSSLYSYGSETDFINQVDNSIAGQMRDCAECHIGGGAMEFIPSAPGTNLTQLSDRRALRDFGDHAGNYTAYSYFITQYTGYDAGASDNITETELGQVRYTDYEKTGVLEMDCLMCHMKGYSWDERKNEIRLGRFDASRAVGSQIATSSINGTAVNYDANYTESGFGLFGLNKAARELIVRTPPSENCASCHFDQHQVDWKKRGTSWQPIHPTL